MIARDDTLAKSWWLYALKLEQGKYYVGITSKTPEIRFNEHLHGIRAANWTQQYKPVEIIYTENMGQLIESVAEERELKKTRELMKAYGWENVRGGRFAAISYKKRLGILWRIKTNEEMPTETDWWALVAVLTMTAVLCIVGVLLIIVRHHQ